MFKHRLLIVDDDSIVRTAINRILSGTYDVIEAEDYDTAIEAYNNNDVSLTILDIRFGKVKNGIDILKKIKSIDTSAYVLMLTSVSDISSAISCMKLGAIDYILKTTETITKGLKIKIDQILQRDIDQRTYQGTKILLNKDFYLISNSKKIKNILNEIKSVGNLRILIEGETGVGKTPIAMYANSILSKKTNRPFVTINCAGLSKERFQDIMFGHKKGAFTGAVDNMEGLVEVARGGDLFLDEVGDLNSECQAELLTFLDNGEFRRLGDPVVRKSDCRIIAATNCDVTYMVKNNQFRKDLYSRLSQCKIFVPPLRLRKEDVKFIMEYYIRQNCGYDKPYNTEILDLYKKHDWAEGNVRELKDAVYYMCEKSRDNATIELQHVNSNYYCVFDNEAEKNIFNECSKVMLEDIYAVGFDYYMSLFEKRLLLLSLDECKTQRVMAKKLKLSNPTLCRKLQKYNIEL